MRTDSDLSKLVNQSGFPLQLALDRLIQDRSANLRWRVVYREHGWRSEDGQSGFADLVLEDEYRTSVLVVECKRVLESDWVFLEPAPSGRPTTATRLWATNTPNYSGYYDARVAPESPVSMYCVVAGQDPKGRPMLERIAAEVSAATEAIAGEEHPILLARTHGLRMYAAVVVTTARLICSRVDASKIELKTGEAADLSHREVPWIRFRKQLAPEYAMVPDAERASFPEIAAAKEKTVFVVNVEAFAEFLERWSVNSDSLHTLMHAGADR